MMKIFAMEFNITHASHKNLDGDWGMLPKAGPYNMSGEWGGVMGDVINGYAQFNPSMQSLKSSLRLHCFLFLLACREDSQRGSETKVGSIVCAIELLACQLVPVSVSFPN